MNKCYRKNIIGVLLEDEFSDQLVDLIRNDDPGRWLIDNVAY